MKMINDLSQYLTENRDQYEVYLFENPHYPDTADLDECNMIVTSCHNLATLHDKKRRLEETLEQSRLMREQRRREFQNRYKTLNTRIEETNQEFNHKIREETLNIQKINSTPAPPSLLNRVQNENQQV